MTSPRCAGCRTARPRRRCTSSRRMIAWWGPILYEYYAATEGGTFFVDSEAWLRRPGTVGRSIGGRAVRILDEAGNPVPVGRPGYVYFVVPPEGRFEYFKAPEKTAAAHRGDFYTLGDIGYLDEDGYLFLTGRSAETIISGGVNIYPQEVDDTLSRHPGRLRCLYHRRAGREVGRERQVGGRARSPATCRRQSWSVSFWLSAASISRPSSVPGPSTSGRISHASPPARSCAARSGRPTGRGGTRRSSAQGTRGSARRGDDRPHPVRFRRGHEVNLIGRTPAVVCMAP